VSWFKVDDGLWGHPKWLATPPTARALWVTAGSWCADQLTDGVIPTHVLPIVGGKPKDAAALVAVGLWDRIDEGWVFHDWPAFQPSRESVLADRAAAKDRQRKARERARQLRAESREMSRRDTGVSNGPPDPTRPDPTVVPTELPESTTAPRARSAGQRGTRINLDFPVTDDMRRWAEGKGYTDLDLTDLTEEFVDYWRSVPGAKGTKIDWQATWRNRVRDVAERRKVRPLRPVVTSPWDRAIDVTGLGTPR